MGEPEGGKVFVEVGVSIGLQEDSTKTEIIATSTIICFIFMIKPPGIAEKKTIINFLN